jgi:hypothetical protein
LTTGREPRRDYLYIQVAKGQGTHTWIDYNGDGLKQFNEFEVAVYQDQGEYIRVITPSNVLVTTLGTQFQTTLKIQPERFFKEGKAQQLFRRFTNQTNLRSSQKVLAATDTRSNEGRDTLAQALNPFFTSLPPDKLLNRSWLLRNVLFINRNDPVWGADVSYQETRQHQLLVSGYESRRTQETAFNIRRNLGTKWVMEANYVFGSRLLAADYAKARNFSILQSSPGGQLSWQPTIRMRWQLSYKYTTQRDTLGKESRSTGQDAGLELRMNWASKGMLQGRIHLIKLTYSPSGDPQSLITPIAYEMLQGLRPGTNYTWNLTWNQRMQGNLQLQLQYDGRTGENQKPVHIGRANVTWFF